MKTRPILMSAPMVRALLAGTKTQTRRAIKPQPTALPDGTWHVDTRPASGYSSEATMRAMLPVYCPYGTVGDRLWVRETWAPGRVFKGDVQEYLYRATHTHAPPCSWRPSIFMPRAASRITLELTAVRIERLGDITEADAIAEGIEPLFDAETIRTTVGFEPYRFGARVPWTNYLWHGRGGSEGYSSALDARDSYRSLWDSINGKTHPWASSPWVWVLSFQRVMP